MIQPWSPLGWVGPAGLLLLAACSPTDPPLTVQAVGKYELVSVNGQVIEGLEAWLILDPDGTYRHGVDFGAEVPFPYPPGQITRLRRIEDVGYWEVEDGEIVLVGDVARARHRARLDGDQLMMQATFWSPQPWVEFRRTHP